MHNELYTVTQEYTALLEKDEYTAEDMELLEQLNKDVKQHAINIAAHIQNKEGYKLSILNAKARLKERLNSLDVAEDRLQSRIDFWSKYLLAMLQKANIDQITDNPELQIKRKLNPPKMVITNQSLIPQEYYVEWKEFRLNTTKVKDLLKANKEVPGVELIQNERLEIK